MQARGVQNNLSNPFFSIILPSYNRTHLLPRAIDSVIRQSFVEWELIVVDDGSTDDTRDVVLSYVIKDDRIKYFSHTHSGLARTRNLGLKYANGMYITFIDSDDEYRTEHLSVRHYFLAMHPDVDLLHGGVTIIGNEYVADKFNPEKKIHLSDCAIGGTFFIRSGLVEKIGGFPLVDYGDDAVFFERAKETNAVIAKIEEPTYVYHREGTDSMCAIVEREGMEALKIFQGGGKAVTKKNN